MNGKDNNITIKGVFYRIVWFLDDDGETTTDESEVCMLVLQRPEDRRPDGIEQNYKVCRIRPGSLERIVTQ